MFVINIALPQTDMLYVFRVVLCLLAQPNLDSIKGLSAMLAWVEVPKLKWGDSFRTPLVTLFYACKVVK